MDKNKFELPKCEYIFFDIAANLCSEQFQGIYHDKKYHETDVDEVIERANKMGVKKMLFAAGDFEDTKVRNGLLKTAEIFGTTISWHKGRHYWLANLAIVGEAIMLAMRTNTPGTLMEPPLASLR